jgi:glycosyltransferase involved in cell wall biosynthesis
MVWMAILHPLETSTCKAARVVQLLTDDSLYDRMSSAARRTAETRFASSRIIPQYEQLYREVCDHR